MAELELAGAQVQVTPGICTYYTLHGSHVSCPPRPVVNGCAFNGTGWDSLLQSPKGRVKKTKPTIQV